MHTRRPYKRHPDASEDVGPVHARWHWRRCCSCLPRRRRPRHVHRPRRCKANTSVRPRAAVAKQSILSRARSAPLPRQAERCRSGQRQDRPLFWPLWSRLGTPSRTWLFQRWPATGSRSSHCGPTSTRRISPTGPPSTAVFLGLCWRRSAESNPIMDASRARGFSRAASPPTASSASRWTGTARRWSLTQITACSMAIPCTTAPWVRCNSFRAPGLATQQTVTATASLTPSTSSMPPRPRRTISAAPARTCEVESEPAAPS